MRKLISAAIFIISMLACLELVSFAGVEYLASKSIVFEPIKAPQKDFSVYESEKDPATGWPTASGMKQCQKDTVCDVIGSRACPYFPDAKSTPPCITLYGESFTLSADRPAAKAWGNLLSRHFNCRVSNFAVGGFGTDQAYLRFLANTSDPSSIVVMGVVTENILRNVNQYRRFLYQDNNPFTFKPRFIIGQGNTAQLVPMPQITFQQFPEFQKQPEQFLCHECFLPGGKWGLTKKRFPYTVTLYNALFKQFHMQALSQGKPWHAPMYDPGHPCQGVQVTAGILEQFCAEARNRGKVPIVVVMPTYRDLEYFRKSHEWVYTPLLKAMDNAGITYIDAGPGLYASLNGADTTVLYDKWRAHFSEEGERRLSEIIINRMQSLKLIPTTPPTP